MTRFVRFPFLLVLLSVVSFSTAIAGGDRHSPRIVGMGRTFTAFARGLDAVGTNPANLALDDRNATVTVNLFPIGVSIGSDFINLKVYNDFFTGMENPADPGGDRIARPLSPQDKEDILALFPGGIGRTQFGTEVSPLGLSLQIGDFGFGVSPYAEVAGNVDLTQDYMKFALNGFEPNGSVYSFNGTAVNMSAVAGANASFGYLLPVEGFGLTDIAVGVGVKYLVGIAYVATDHYDGSIRTVVTPSPVAGVPEEIAIRSDLNFMQFVAIDTADGQPVGNGMGFDLGVNATVLDLFQVGVAVTDIGSVTWDKYTKAVIGRASMSLTSFDKAAQDSLSKIFKGETKDTTAFTFDLPTQVHIGVAARMDDIFDVIPFRWTLAADLHLGLNEVAGNTKIPQFAIGTELDPLAGWLPLRTGIMIGGRERFAWSAGFGIHILNTFDLDFATQSLAIISNPETFRTGSFTMGMRLRF